MVGPLALLLLLPLLLLPLLLLPLLLLLLLLRVVFLFRVVPFSAPSRAGAAHTIPLGGHHACSASEHNKARTSNENQ